LVTLTDDTCGEDVAARVVATSLMMRRRPSTERTQIACTQDTRALCFRSREKRGERVMCFCLLDECLLMSRIQGE
jgi:hypothetical protein